MVGTPEEFARITREMIDAAHKAAVERGDYKPTPEELEAYRRAFNITDDAAEKAAARRAQIESLECPLTESVPVTDSLKSSMAAFWDCHNRANPAGANPIDVAGSPPLAQVSARDPKFKDKLAACILNDLPYEITD
jgi:hypothetical protein